MRENAKQSRIIELRAMLSPGDTVYTTLKHVSRSGMMRVIDLRVIRGDVPHRITWSVCQALGYPYNDKHDGLRVDGCGMDMGFHVVYNLGHVIWPNGTPEPHGRRNGVPDSAGGYALKHQWM